MKTHFVETHAGRIACHESSGAGPVVVLVHGNSSSAKAFARQIDGPLGGRHRLIGIDLPGHGASGNALDARVYCLPGYAQVLLTVAETLGLGAATFAAAVSAGISCWRPRPILPARAG